METFCLGRKWPIIIGYNSPNCPVKRTALVILVRNRSLLWLQNMCLLIKGNKNRQIKTKGKTYFDGEVWTWLRVKELVCLDIHTLIFYLCVWCSDIHDVCAMSVLYIYGLFVVGIVIFSSFISVCSLSINNSLLYD